MVDRIPIEWGTVLSELAARGLTVCEITHRENVLQHRDISNMSSGEPSVVTASPGNQKSGDVPTREDGSTGGSPLLNRRVNMAETMAETEKMLSEPAGSHSAEQHKENAVPLSCDEAKQRTNSKPSELSPQTFGATPDVSDREQAIARYLVGQGMESWRAETEARAIIAADPWTNLHPLVTQWNLSQGTIGKLRAEVERLRAALHSVVNMSDQKKIVNVALSALTEKQDV